MAKCEVKQQNVEFQPVKITLTLTTKEEFHAISDLCATNISVPNCVFPYDEEFRKVLADILTLIHTELVTRG